MKHPARHILILAIISVFCLIAPSISRAETKKKIKPLPADQWPAFRGDGLSRTTARNLPMSWDEKTNIRWTLNIDGYGQSSPVVWQDTVILTSIKGKMQETLQVHCIDLNTGETRWEKQFPTSKEIESTNFVSKAAPTPIIDSKRIYTFFESGDLFCFDHQGQLLWQRSLEKDFGKFENRHGLGGSPAQTEETLIIQVTHAGPSYLLCLDKQTGKDIWKTDITSTTAWTSPTVITDCCESTIYTSTNGSAEAYDAGTGKRKWTVGNLTKNTVASPTLAPTTGDNRSDLLLVGSSIASSSIAVKLGGEGDVTKSHVAWSAERGANSFSSPLAVGDRAYYINKAGVLNCVDLTTGKSLWANRLPDSCWASPVADADGLIYIFTKKGKTVVIDSNEDDYTVIAENNLPTESIVYGIAPTNSNWLIREGSKLTCITTPQTSARK